MNRRLLVANTLASCVCRLDAVLAPWGFNFQSDGIHPSHIGPFACGHFVRGATRIGLTCFDTLNCIHYEHTFVTVHACSRESERFIIGHPTLMRAVGHADDCWLIASDEMYKPIKARDGGDRIAALVHDLRFFAEPLLREPSDDFYAAVRRGGRSYSIDSNGAG